MVSRYRYLQYECPDLGGMTHTKDVYISQVSSRLQVQPEARVTCIQMKTLSTLIIPKHLLGEGLLNNASVMGSLYDGHYK